jgi:hypothetical protein
MYWDASGSPATACIASNDSIVDSAPAFLLSFSGEGPSIPSNVTPVLGLYIAMFVGFAPANHAAVNPAKIA